jgi:hypothetical protein
VSSNPVRLPILRSNSPRNSRRSRRSLRGVDDRVGDQFISQQLGPGRSAPRRVGQAASPARFPGRTAEPQPMRSVSAPAAVSAGGMPAGPMPGSGAWSRAGIQRQELRDTEATEDLGDGGLAPHSSRVVAGQRLVGWLATVAKMVVQTGSRVSTPARSQMIAGGCSARSLSRPRWMLGAVDRLIWPGLVSTVGCVELRSGPGACQVEVDQLLSRRVGLGRLGRWLDTVIHPVWVIPAHSRLPKIAVKGSAQRWDGVA